MIYKVLIYKVHYSKFVVKILQIFKDRHPRFVSGLGCDFQGSLAEFVSVPPLPSFQGKNHTNNERPKMVPNKPRNVESSQSKTKTCTDVR
jgi:hypothetical protein